MMKHNILNEKSPALGGYLGNPNDQIRSDNNSPNAQRARILQWFSTVSPRLSTLDARQKLGIMSPAPRIGELRHKYGHKIELQWMRQKDTTGTLHRVGVYVYVSPPYGLHREAC